MKSQLPRFAVRAGIVAVTCGALLAGNAPDLQAQRRGGGGNVFGNSFGGGGNCSPQGSNSGGNRPYDGRFIMTRMYYSGHNGWCFDWPDMERNFVKILREITALRPVMTASNVLSFDDPELMKFPFVYVSEPGYWNPSVSELDGMKAYMLKGGLVFFDDFMQGEWWNFEGQFRRAFPDAEFYRLDNSHAIFDTFYKIENLAIPYPNSGGSGLFAEFYAVYKDNDPRKPMMAVISYNSDLGDYMEWSGTGRNPINLANEAYKFAVNFVVYAMTR